ncbi:MAG: hypothetical protein ACI90E_001773, partial [Yoonia sp.]
RGQCLASKHSLLLGKHAPFELKLPLPIESASNFLMVSGGQSVVWNEKGIR